MEAMAGCSGRAGDVRQCQSALGTVESSIAPADWRVKPIRLHNVGMTYGSGPVAATRAILPPNLTGRCAHFHDLHQSATMAICAQQFVRLAHIRIHHPISLMSNNSAQFAHASTPGNTPIAICGAGIAGIAAAWFLSVRAGFNNITLIDERRPLSLTSDKSTEAYRNWWPGPDDAMLRLMNRSIDLLEEFADTHDNAIMLNRRGYFYATARQERADTLRAEAELAERMGAGTLRIHTGSGTSYVPAPVFGYANQPSGSDLLLGREVIERHFPWLAPDTIALLHARRCGWLSGQQLGMLLFEEARAAGVRFISGRVAAVNCAAGAVESVSIAQGDAATQIPADIFVNAAGPFARAVAALLDVDLPLFSERHLKIAFDDRLGALPRNAGLIICEDPITLPWRDDERAELAANPETAWLTETLPAGVHMRPEGLGAESQTVLLLWAYHTQRHPEIVPVPLDGDFSEVALRGMARLVPGLLPYTERLPKSYMDGGYYTKTAENRPLIGPLPVHGAFVIAGLSGYGLMAACAAGELLAAHVAGAPLPTYAPAFCLERYAEPSYLARMHAWGSGGQL